MRVCKYLKQRVRRVKEQNGKTFKGISKQTRKKKKTKRLSFIITQFKIEFLLPFTSCRKVLEKMPDQIEYMNAPKHFLASILELTYVIYDLLLSKIL